MRFRRHFAPGVLLFLSSSLAAAADGPGLRVDELVWDAGMVAPDQKVEHAFALRNEGPATVRVLQVGATCGCTVAHYDREIAPGASGEVRAAVDTTHFRPGPFQKTVNVETDDPALPRLTLTLRGDLQPHVVVSPHRLRWTVATDGSGNEARTVAVWSPAIADFAVTAVETSEPWLVAAAREARPEERPAESRGRVWLVDVRLAPTTPAGPLRGEVRLRTSHPSQMVAEVPISGFIAPRAGAS